MSNEKKITGNNRDQAPMIRKSIEDKPINCFSPPFTSYHYTTTWPGNLFTGSAGAGEDPIALGFEVSIDAMNERDYESVRRSSDFELQWGPAPGEAQYKLSNLSTGEIVGLMSIVNDKAQKYIRIRAIEIGKQFRGKHLEWMGCLLAYACRYAFREGYNGTVTIKVSGELNKQLRENFGMLCTGGLCLTLSGNSQKLIKKYL